MNHAGICFLIIFLFATEARNQMQSINPKNQNERNVIAFYEAGPNRKDFAAASQYIGSIYKQHNLTAANGAEGFNAYIMFLKEKYPDAHWTFMQIFSDGNYVILHAHEQLSPSVRGSVVIDIYRLEKSKIVEHWDVVQPIPEKPTNGNTMF